MIAGHFGLAAGVKKFAPRLPLWALFLATLWLDVVFLAFSAAGLETIVPLDPAHPAYGEIIVHADYTHSLVGAALIALLTGGLAAWHWGKRGGAYFYYRSAARLPAADSHQRRRVLTASLITLALLISLHIANVLGQ